MAQRHTTKARKPRQSDDGVDDLVAKLEPLVQKLQELKQQAAALGIFTNDRELLRCPRCGLGEDVAAGGYLMTYREPDFARDTGLRFVETDTPGSFRCPSCGEIVHEPEEPTADFE